MFDASGYRTKAKLMCCSVNFREFCDILDPYATKGLSSQWEDQFVSEFIRITWDEINNNDFERQLQSKVRNEENPALA